MGPLTRRWPLFCAALAAAALITSSTPSSGAAETAAESAALLQLYAAESALAHAQADLQRLEARSTELARAEQGVRRRTEIVRRSLAASQQRVAALLRDLYVQGEPDPIAVILGATSLDEAMAGIEGLSRATALNERLGVEAEQRARRLAQLRLDLTARRQSLDSARSRARTGAARLAAAVTAQRETITTLRRRQSLTAQRLAALRSRAREAEQRSAGITRAAVGPSDDGAPQATSDAAAEAPAAPAAPVAAAGTRSFVADAVAYHLPGKTASGLPVGVGVIAVDPTVIPLGTRVFIPGYGPAVAADVGTAVKGNIIDLWMPSTAQALAWGRRTVTITIYG